MLFQKDHSSKDESGCCVVSAQFFLVENNLIGCIWKEWTVCMKRKKEKKEKSLCPINKLQIVDSLPVTLNECNDTRNMLNKKYLCKVKHKAEN